MLDYRCGRVVDFYDVACARVRVCACAILKYYIWTEAFFMLTIIISVCQVKKVRVCLFMTHSHDELLFFLVYDAANNSVFYHNDAARFIRPHGTL